MNTDPEIDDFEKRLEQAQNLRDQREGKSVPGAPPVSSEDKANWSIGIEFVTTILLGTAAGYGLDKWLGTFPVFFLILFLTGNIVAFYNIYRLTNNYGSKIGFSGLQNTKKDDKKAPQQTHLEE